MTTALMVDLETGATGPDAAIVAAAFVVFDTLDPPGTFIEEFSCAIDPAESDKHGRRFSGSTLSWWTSQPEALTALGKMDLRSLLQMCEALDKLVTKNRVKEIWANSPSFDITILRHLYNSMSRRFPMQFYAERDVRTIKSVLPVALHPKFVGAKHDALADTQYQAVLVQTFFNNIGIVKHPCSQT